MMNSNLVIKAPGQSLTIEAVYDFFEILENKCDGKWWTQTYLLKLQVEA